MLTAPKTFARYPAEGAIIGRLLIEYGDLEFSLAHCVSMITGNQDTAFKVMFRVRGESHRIQMGDALGRNAIAAGPNRDLFERTIAHMHRCLKIRNLYAHCIWLENMRHGLVYVALEEVAKQNGTLDLTKLSQHPAPLSLLQAQEAYFAYVDDCLHFLNFEAQFAAGRIAIQPLPRPPGISEPPIQMPKVALNSRAPTGGPTTPP